MLSGEVPFVPHFCDPSVQPAPWHSRSAYVPPGAGPLLTERVRRLRIDYDQYEHFIREERKEELAAKKGKRKPQYVFAQRVKEFDWPAHAHVAAELARDWTHWEEAEKHRKELERLQSLPCRRRQCLRALLEVAGLIQAADAIATSCALSKAAP